MFISIVMAAILAQAPSGLGDASTKARPAQASVRSSDAAARLIAKRRAKKSAAYIARLDRESGP
jgi:hypothetical protein